MPLNFAYGDGFAGAANFATEPDEGENVLYIVGDNDTDGSIRIAFLAGEDVAHIESRADGVWNDDGLRVASSSLDIGRDMTVSAIAGFLETNNPSAVVGHVKGLIPHVLFDDAGTGLLRTPILDAEEIFTVFDTTVGEIIGTTIGINIGATPGRAIEESIHQTGSVAATSKVTVSFYVGSDNTGFLFNRKVLPASAFPADSEIEIPYDNDLGFEANSPVFMEFTSANNLSLKTDASGNPLTKHEAHALDELGVITENTIYDEDLGHVLDESLNPVYGAQF
ncbi:MAG: hypothetical protein V3W44_10125 [Dehalococcoidales bacterium]